ncbi:MAG: type III PLP-dependent enzyme [Hydrogenobacter thermophilus]|uniref:type III PLP-dependent enzyme n=1 Tax=Hydrogenobacter thermophilus TaxID=940 RepID=UPI001C758ADF|nr:type III PLP-dependent enzyme [Hydrogenobacter thermophilus]QWK20417.1 MAG: type III PLP-dependent enzyme [Hydrogenobacter thermophilus]
MVKESLDQRELQFQFAKRYFEEFISQRPHLQPYLKPQETPLLLLDLEGIKSRYKEIELYMPNFRIYYAVKANDDINIIKALSEKGSGFEVASLEELKKVLSLKVEPERIISSNPVKSEEFIDYAYSVHVNRFAVDSFTEVEKIAKVAKRARVYVRLVVPNEGSDWPLSKKFGVDVDTAIDILEYAREKGLVPYGITFHVGSQCNNYRNWFIAIRKSAELWEKAKRRGFRLQMLNMGGGIPVKYTYEALRIEDIAYYIKGLLQKFFPNPPYELQIEPGRGIVGDQGIMITRIIGKAKRNDENWLYVDTGVFNGLAEALGGIRYPFYVDREGELKEWTIGGVSCDSMDVIAKMVALPEPEVGDHLYILSAGAYTTVYASNFNGFPTPKVLCL